MLLLVLVLCKATQETLILGLVILQAVLEIITLELGQILYFFQQVAQMQDMGIFQGDIIQQEQTKYF